jgi:hypothetical protein
MTGGEGADTFVFRANGSPGLRTGTGTVDRITDFELGVDKIDLSHSSFGDVVFLGNASNLRATGTLIASGEAGTISAVFNAANSTLYVDRDGNGVIGNQDFVLRLSGITQLSESDFIF